jgi:hypothetical protein
MRTNPPPGGVVRLRPATCGITATTFDSTVPVQLHTERLIDALKARGKDFGAKIYERAPGGHGFNQGDTEPGRDSADRIFAFLAKHLKP